MVVWVGVMVFVDLVRLITSSLGVGYKARGTHKPGVVLFC